MGDRPLLIDVLEDRRRLAYCLAGALVVHALAVTLRYWHPRRPLDEPPPPAPIIVPVSLEGAAPEPERPPAAPAPPAPAAAPPPPAEREALALVPKPKPRHEPTPEPKPAPERPRTKPRSSAEAPEVVAREDVAPGEDATAFGGREGAFMALVCFLPRR